MKEQLFITSDATAEFAHRLATHLQAGDTVLLSGPVGAGKSHFARAAIQALLEQPEDIPSPTYTIVQTYTAPDIEVWHVDLYRLTTATELHELGLTEAYEQSICLIEWPDQFMEDMPASALHLYLDYSNNDARIMNISYSDPKWSEKLGIG